MRRLVQFSVGAVACAFTIARAAAAFASDQNVTVQLAVFPCAADAATPPSLRLSAMKRPPEEINVQPQWQRSDAFWSTSLSLPPGRYGLSAESQHCSGNVEQWIAIPGEERHLTFTINKTNVRMLDGYEGMIYGYLPAAAKVEINSEGGATGPALPRIAQTDGNTYQIGWLPPGRYVVQITFGGVTARREVDIVRTLAGLTVRADLTAADAASIVRQQANGSHFASVTNSQKQRVTSFRLGDASAGGWSADTQP